MANSKPLKPVLKALKLEKPKASSSAFVFFGKEMRKVLQEQYPQESFKEISIRLGEQWKRLPETEREYYEELSLIDKSRYKEEKRLYRQQLYKRLYKALQDGTVQPSQIDKSTLPQQKYVRAPFMFYCRHVRPMLKTHIDNDKASIAKPLSVMWNSLNNQQRIPFNQLSQEDVERAREDRLQEQEILAMLS